MLPVVAGPRETKRQMLLYTLVLLPVALAPTLLGAVGWIYGAVALALSLAFIGHAVAVWRTPTTRAASRGAADVLLLAALSRRPVRRPAARPRRGPDTGRMSVAMSRRPPSGRHRQAPPPARQEPVHAVFLLALAAIFFALTLVRMGGQL